MNGVRESFAGPLVKSTYVKLTGNALPFLVTYGVSSALSRRFADFHVSQSQEENARSLGALGRARGSLIRIQDCARVPHGRWSPHPMQDRTSICCLGLARAVTDD